MFKRTSQDDLKLDEAIDRVLDEMANMTADSAEYDQMLGQLERLYSLKPKKKLQKISPDTLAQVLGNLCGILVIVAYEQKHVMTSKALGFVPKTTK